MSRRRCRLPCLPVLRRQKSDPASSRPVCSSAAGSRRRPWLPRLVLAATLAAAGPAAQAWGATLTVTSNADSGPGSLREAIETANGNGEADTIEFAADLVGPIHLTSGQLTVTADLEILGPGADVLTVRRDRGTFRIVEIYTGVTATISGMTLANGEAFNGGGIRNSGTLAITHATVSGNSASDSGGGITNSGTLTITHSTVSGNLANEFGGGGIDNSGALTITHGTVSGNSSDTFSGGGIINGGTLAILNSTVSGNSGREPGGGILIAGQATIRSSIIADNTGGNCSIVVGPFTAEGTNLADDDSCPGFAEVSTADLALGPLQDNGGPTWTHALGATSVAVDAAGASEDCTDLDGDPLTDDQRGMPRPADGDGDGTAVCDLGAYEHASGTPARSDEAPPRAVSRAEGLPAAAEEDLPTEVKNLQDALKARWEGAWAVTSAELYSNCDGSFTSNQVRGRLVEGEGLARFQPGELAKVQKIDVRRSRIDVHLVLEEPLLVPRQDGPYSLYQELRCQAAFEVEVERETVRDKRLDLADSALRQVLEAHPTIAEARDSDQWNGRRREPYPEGYEATLVEYRSWKKAEQNRAVQSRIDQALDRAAVYLDFIARDPTLGRAAATGVASVRGRLPTDCSQLLGLSEEDLPRSAEFSGVVLDYFVAGQRLSFHLEVARKLRGCLLAVD